MSDTPVLPSSPPPYACDVIARTSYRRGGPGLDVLIQTHSVGADTAQLELPPDIGELSRLTGSLIEIIARLAARAEAPR